MEPWRNREQWNYIQLYHVPCKSIILQSPTPIHHRIVCLQNILVKIANGKWKKFLKIGMENMSDLYQLS